MNDVAGDVRVVSWNLHGSAGPDLTRVAAHLRAEAVDLAGLQELRAVHARRLAGLLGWNVRWVFKHFPMTPLLWWRAEGMAILSPHPIVDGGSVVLTPGVSRWSHRRRLAQWADVEAPAGRLRLVNVHLAAMASAGAERVRQAATAIGAVGSDPTLLTGDLNAPDEPAVLDVFSTVGLRDAWSGPGPGHTNPAGAVYQRLDYVLAGREFEVVGCTVPTDDASWAELSDHLPVQTHVRLRDLS